MRYTGPKFVCCKQIADMCDVSVVSARRYSKLPDFPQPFEIGGSVKWLGEEVWAWIMSRRRVRKA